MQLILPMLFVLFVGLKLMGYIAWSWWLVTAPLWGGMILAIVISFCAMSIMTKILLPMGKVTHAPSR